MNPDSQPAWLDRLVRRVEALFDRMLGQPPPQLAEDRTASLTQVVKAATPELEPLRLVALRTGGSELRRGAVAALVEVGSIAALPALREVTERWAPGLARSAQEAIEAIREREGVVAGSLSLVAPADQVGALSTAEARETGGLSET